MLSNPIEIPLQTAVELLGLDAQDGRFVHYGLFSDKENQPVDLKTAQKQFSESLFNKIQSNTKKGSLILLMGQSLHPLVERLSGGGRKVSFLNPSEDSSMPIASKSEEAFFDLIVIEGSIRYLDQLPLLRKCCRELKAGGELILFSEFLDDDSEIMQSDLPNLSSFRQLSLRHGFELKSEEDLTQSAKISLDFLVDKASEVGSTNDSQKQLLSSAQKILQEFDSSRRCFRMFELSYNSRSLKNFSAAEYFSNGEFTAGEISKVFEESFDVSFDEALWRWKYLLGGGKSIAARENPSGPIVAHYGGAPRDIRYFGNPSKAIQVCDVMVLPSVRRHYGKESLFFKTAATFLEREIGNSVNHLLGFGFPNQKAMNIAKRLSLYEKTDDFVELIIDERPQLPTPDSILIDIDGADSGHQAHIDALWSEMGHEFDSHIIGVRDWPYFNYRYFEHPLGKKGGYRRSLLMDAQNNDAIAVLVTREHGETTLIMDIICAHHRVNQVLERIATNCITFSLQQPLKFWLTKAWVDRLQLSGVVENALGIEIPCNTWNPGPSSQTLYGAWWLTAGDMDFI